MASSCLQVVVRGLFGGQRGIFLPSFPFFFFKFYFIFKLYIIVLVLPNIKMNPPPQVKQEMKLPHEKCPPLQQK